MTKDRKRIIVQVEYPLNQTEANEIDKAVSQIYSEETEVLVTTNDVSVMEVPGLDDFADDLAERVAERLE